MRHIQSWVVCCLVWENISARGGGGGGLVSETGIGDSSSLSPIFNNNNKANTRCACSAATSPNATRHVAASPRQRRGCGRRPAPTGWLDIAPPGPHQGPSRSNAPLDSTTTRLRAAPPVQASSVSTEPQTRLSSQHTAALTPDPTGRHKCIVFAPDS